MASLATGSVRRRDVREPAVGSSARTRDPRTLEASSLSLAWPGGRRTAAASKCVVLVALLAIAARPALAQVAPLPELTTTTARHEARDLSLAGTTAARGKPVKGVIIGAALGLAAGLMTASALCDGAHCYRSGYVKAGTIGAVGGAALGAWIELRLRRAPGRFPMVTARITPRSTLRTREAAP